MTTAANREHIRDLVQGQPVTKLPAGEALGADDLQLWGSRRLAGRSGVRNRPKERPSEAPRANVDHVHSLPTARAHQTAGHDGDPCPHCRRPMEIRQHAKLTAKHLRQPYYFSRWFECTRTDCPTTLVMPPRFKVMKRSEQR